MDGSAKLNINQKQDLALKNSARKLVIMEQTIMREWVKLIETTIFKD